MYQIESCTRISLQSNIKPKNVIHIATWLHRQTKKKISKNSFIDRCRCFWSSRISLVICCWPICRFFIFSCNIILEFIIPNRYFCFCTMINDVLFLLLLVFFSFPSCCHHIHLHISLSVVFFLYIESFVQKEYYSRWMDFLSRRHTLVLTWVNHLE